jgi:hypothetical protein
MMLKRVRMSALYETRDRQDGRKKISVAEFEYATINGKGYPRYKKFKAPKGTYWLKFFTIAPLNIDERECD